MLGVPFQPATRIARSVVLSMDIAAEAGQVRSDETYLGDEIVKANSTLSNFQPTEMQVVIMNVNIVTSLVGLKQVGKREIVHYFDSGLNTQPEFSLKRDQLKKRKRDESEETLLVENGCSVPVRTRQAKIHTDFANCVTIVYHGELSSKHISIKVYNNGKLQISGCKTIDRVLSVANRVCVWLSKVYNIPVTVVSFSIACINIACYVHKEGNRKNSLNLKQMEASLIETGYWPGDNKSPLQSVQLSADISPAIIIRHKRAITDPNATFQKGLTAMVYRCGYVKFAGLKRHSDAIAFYKFVVSFLDRNWQNIVRNL